MVRNTCGDLVISSDVDQILLCSGSKSGSLVDCRALLSYICHSKLPILQAGCLDVLRVDTVTPQDANLRVGGLFYDLVICPLEKTLH